MCPLAIFRLLRHCYAGHVVKTPKTKESHSPKNKKNGKRKTGKHPPTEKKKENVKKKEGQHPAAKETCASDFICHY